MKSLELPPVYKVTSLIDAVEDEALKTRWRTLVESIVARTVSGAELYIVEPPRDYRGYIINKRGTW